MATVVPPAEGDIRVKEIDTDPNDGMSASELAIIAAIEGKPAPAKAKTEQPNEEIPAEEPVAEVTTEEVKTEEPVAEVPAVETKVSPEVEALQKELATAKEGSARAIALQAQLDAKDKAEPVKISVDASNPLGDVLTHEALEAKVADAGKWVDWCENHPEGGTVTDPNGKTIEWSAQEVQSMKSRQNAILRASYSRGLFVMKYETERESAKASFPTIFDSASPDYARRQEILREFPSLLSKPNFLSVVGKIIEGEKAVASRKTTATPVKPVVKAPVKPLASTVTRGVSAPGGTRPVAKDLDAEYNAAIKRGDLTAANKIVLSQISKFNKGDE
jgi:hypothetical protein